MHSERVNWCRVPTQHKSMGWSSHRSSRHQGRGPALFRVSTPDHRRQQVCACCCSRGDEAGGALEPQIHRRHSSKCAPMVSGELSFYQEVCCKTILHKSSHMACIDKVTQLYMYSWAIQSATQTMPGSPGSGGSSPSRSRCKIYCRSPLPHHRRRGFHQPATSR